MGVLDLFGKNKSAKPPRRISIPTKSMATIALKPLAGNITLISESRTKRSVNKNDTSLSNYSKASTRKKFNVGGVFIGARSVMWLGFGSMRLFSKLLASLVIDRGKIYFTL
ncbi:unnamed protein product [Dovyalis caffra]|uniref:Uncharacterized protein n=1 Tax=Dovyalis caffra TaxID=77055 RepID=A0AAV1RM54_9ROSI|nr:unnamed protein product [Dovyalis caffra]